MTLDFENDKQYKDFVYSVADCILADAYNNEIIEDLAAEIVDRYLDKLSEEVFNRVIREIALQKGENV